MRTFQFPSPTEFEQRWKLREHKIVDWLHAHDSRSLKMIAVFCIVTMAVFTNFLIDQEKIHRFTGGFRMMKLARDGIPLTVALSFTMLHFEDIWRSVFLVSSLVIIWALTSYVDLAQTSVSSQSMLVLCLMPVLCALSFFYLRTKAQFRQSTIGITLYTVFFWSIYLGGVWLLAEHNPSYIFLALLKLKTPFLWLTSMAFAFETSANAEAASIGFNPLNAIYGVLWPYDFHTEKDRVARHRLWWSGAVLVLWGYLLVIFRAWGTGFFSEDGSASISRSVWFYVLVLLGDVAAANVITGLARVFGFGVREATHFAFLSKKPSEFWKRVSVYNYLFVLQYIKLPLFRKYRNQFWSTFVALWFYFLTRRAIDVLQTLSGPPTGYQEPLLLQILRFLSIVFTIIITQRYWFFTRDEMEQPLKGWVSIFVSHLIFVVTGSITWFTYHHFIPNSSWLI